MCSLLILKYVQITLTVLNKYENAFYWDVCTWLKAKSVNLELYVVI